MVGMSLSLGELSCLVAVGECRSIAKAADRLRYSPSALSRIVRDIEGRGGGTLVIRSGWGVRLTPTGEELVALTRDLFTQYQGLLLAARGDVAGRQGRRDGLLVAVPAEVPVPAAERVIRALRAEVPGPAPLPILTGGREQLWQLLDSGFVDLALGPPPADSGRFAGTEVHAASAVVICAAGDPLSSAGRCRPEDLRGRRVLVGRDAVPALRESLSPFRVVVEAWPEGDVAVVAHLVAGAGCIVLAPDPGEGGWTTVFTDPTFTVLPPVGFEYRHPLVLSWRTGSGTVDPPWAAAVGRRLSGVPHGG